MASVSIDPKIRLKLCSELQEIATELYKEPTELLEVDKVKELKEFYSEKNPALTDSVQFHQLISKCELILPEPKVAPRNPELEARIKKLKVKQEQREYEKMTGNVDPWRTVELIDRQDKPISKQCFSRKFMNSYASFSGRNKSLPPAGLSICSLNGFSVCLWIFGTILLLWNHSSWPQTSLRNHFGLCCWNGRPLFCHQAFTPYGRCD